MRNYNLYVNNQYMCTSLCSLQSQANELASDLALWLYDLCPKKSESACLDLADWHIKYEEVKATRDELAWSLYTQERSKHIEYKAVLTEEDTIPESELIYDYIIDNDDSGNSSSSGN